MFPSTGANLPPTEVPVPLGTTVYDVDGNELIDLIKPGERFVAAQGWFSDLFRTT